MVVTAETVANGTVVIDVAVNGSGLRPRDDMLVQIIGLKEFSGTIVDDEPLCETSQRENPIADEKGEMLAWERLGPDTKGNVEGTVKVEVAAGAFQGVCAYGAFAPEGEKATGGLTNDEASGDKTDGDKADAETTNLNTARDTTSYLRLEPPAAEPTTATTTAPPSSRPEPVNHVCPRHSRGAGGA